VEGVAAAGAQLRRDAHEPGAWHALDRVVLTAAAAGVPAAVVVAAAAAAVAARDVDELHPLRRRARLEAQRQQAGRAAAHLARAEAQLLDRDGQPLGWHRAAAVCWGPSFVVGVVGVEKHACSARAGGRARPGWAARM
jgi:hypothetical protein